MNHQTEREAQERYLSNLRARIARERAMMQAAARDGLSARGTARVWNRIDAMQQQADRLVKVMAR